jgi:type IV secretion system protein VirB10
MPVKEIGDPRLQALFGASDPRDGGVRPTVRLPGRGLPPIFIAGAILLMAVLLFTVLNSRRTQPSEPSTQARAADNGGSAWAPPPPLYVPPAPEPVMSPPAEQSKPQPALVPVPAPVATSAPVPVPAAPPLPQAMPAPVPAPPPPERTSAGSALVIDTGGAQGAAPSASGTGGVLPGSSTQAVARVRASGLANRSMTVPQGHLIPAVLETGFDSTKPGFARAIVARDVRGFDGKNVLIPRGSRLIGDYQSVATQGQNRAVITWTRLIRPDGMTIVLDSPAVDPLGRGGVKASVNSHFFARLGDALLQSTVGLGQALANRAVTGPVVVLPGNTISASSPAVTGSAGSYAPTLKVPPGKSISVFVAHDLDFSAAGGVR